MNILLLGCEDPITIALGASILENCIPGSRVQASFFEPINFPIRWDVFNEICDDWGIQKLSDIRLVRISTESRVENFTHIICTNAELCSAFEFGNQPLKKYILPQRIPWEIEEIISLPKDQLRRKVARIGGDFIACAVNIFSYNSFFGINAFIPYFDSDLELALVSAQFEAKNCDGVVIDSDFRIRDINFGKNNADLFTYDPRKINVHDFEKIPSGAIVVPKFEVSRPERVLLSHNWVRSILQIASFRSVNIVTAPRSARGKYFPESYLVSGLASRISKIGI